MLIRFFGLRRSGNHAVINWLLGLLERPLFLNDVALYGSPVQTFSTVTVPRGVRTLRFGNRLLLSLGSRTLGAVQFVRGGGPARNGDVLCSYENVELRQLDRARLAASLAGDLGEYGVVRDILVVRNPLNLAASCLALRGRAVRPGWRAVATGWVLGHVSRRGPAGVPSEHKRELTLEELVSRWKGYAAEAVRHQQGEPTSYLPVIFDRFVADRAYRDRLAAELGMTNADRYTDFVSNAGRGSSFQGLARPEPGALLTRWRETGVVDLLRPIVGQDQEFRDCCERLFSPEAVDRSLWTLG